MSRKVLVVAALVVACKTAPPVSDRAKEHNDVGVKYLSDGNLEKAEIRFQMALEQREDYPEPYNNLCLLEIKRNHIDKAKEYCIKALHLNQDFAEAHNNLGSIYLQQDSLLRAQQEFASAIHINPDFVAARYNLATVLRKLKKKDEARVELIKLAESHLELADPHHDLCGMDIDDGDLKEAITECRQAIHLDPKYTEAYDLLGVALFKSGSFCDASQAFRDCLGLQPDNVECRQNITEANQKCALVDPGGQQLKDQAAAEGTGAAMLRLGMDQLSKGLVQDAQHSFMRCVRIEPPTAECFCQLSKLAHSESQRENEISDCRQCLKLSPAEPHTPEKRACEKLLGTAKGF